MSLAEWVVALLLLCSGAVVLIAAIGLLRLPDFFLRMHAPALASTLAAWIVTFASIVHFSSRGQGDFAARVADHHRAVDHRADHDHRAGARRTVPDDARRGIIPCPHRCGGEAEQWRKRRTLGRQTSACWKRCGRPCLPTIGRPAGVR
jgi:hypothetical protein